MNDPLHCVVHLIDDHDVPQTGRLAGLTYLVKDLFDVAGHPTTAGSPDFAVHRGIPGKDAWAVERLRRNGARILGKTHLHEMAYGITGVNRHYGTPTNPAAPDRIPGGSSSGSAVAVAGGLAPFALGTDTGGSIRVPAGFCGVYGLRPTQGYIPIEGVVALAPSLDTVGVLARNAEILSRAGEVLLSPPMPFSEFRFERLLIAKDALAMSDSACQKGLLRVVKALGGLGLSVEECATGRLEQARDTQRVLQAAEAWATHQEWIENAAPRLGADVRALFNFGSALKSVEIGRAASSRVVITQSIERLLGGNTILVMPTAPWPAPRIADLDDAPAAFDIRMRILALSNLVSLTGHPAVTVPAMLPDQLPTGVQIVGPKGSDRALLALTRAIEDSKASDASRVSNGRFPV